MKPLLFKLFTHARICNYVFTNKTLYSEKKKNEIKSLILRKPLKILALTTQKTKISKDYQAKYSQFNVIRKLLFFSIQSSIHF